METRGGAPRVRARNGYSIDLVLSYLGFQNTEYNDPSRSSGGCLIGAVSVEHFLCLIRLVHVSSESVCGVALAGAVERNVVWCTAHDPVIHMHNLDLLSMSTSQSV